MCRDSKEAIWLDNASEERGANAARELTKLGPIVQDLVGTVRIWTFSVNENQWQVLSEEGSDLTFILNETL